MQSNEVQREFQWPKQKTPAPSDDLNHYHRLIGLLADRVRSVAHRFQTGAYVVGRPGSGKTFTVKAVLDEAESNYVLLNGRVSPAALFDTLEERPDSVVVIDDVPTLFDNLQAAQLLMAAIGGDPGQSRRVTYVTKSNKRVTEFRGGVIAVSNRPLRHDPVSQALASRLVVLEHEPTDEMLIAFMAAEARKGVKDVLPADSDEVFRYVVAVCRAADYRIDLRYFFKGVEDYRFWKSGACQTDWQSLVRSSMRRVTAGELPVAPTTRAGTKSAEHEVVRDLHARKLSRKELEAEWGGAPGSRWTASTGGSGSSGCSEPERRADQRKALARG